MYVERTLIDGRATGAPTRIARIAGAHERSRRIGASGMGIAVVQI